MFRFSRKGEGIEDADTIDGARELVDCPNVPWFSSCGLWFGWDG